MKILDKTRTSSKILCPYLEGRHACFSHFYATDLSAKELDSFLSRGWRKFGIYYFRPTCPGCRECVPIRIRTAELVPSKSQRRVLKACRNVRVKFRELEYRDEIFELYRDHSMNRFGRESGVEEFRNSFYTQSCPTLQSEYYVGDRLAGAGFIDRSSSALSSIYFIFGSKFSDLRLGTFSVLQESAYALSLGLKYYYLGYYIMNSPRMAYKNAFHLNEKRNWNTGRWLKEKRDLP